MVDHLAVITPVHKASLPYLHEAALSLADQGVWFRWVLGLNGGVTSEQVLDSVPATFEAQLVPCERRAGRVGALKAALCGAAVGGGHDVLVELDADDILAPTCLEKIAHAFEDDRVHFAYSDAAHFRDLGDGKVEACPPYDARAGWTSYEVVTGRPGWPTLNAIPHPLLDAHSVSSVLYAPDHVRAWRASSYAAVGGHDSSLPVCDDVDLSQRFYLRYGAGGFCRIAEPLYYYRRHAGQETSKQDDPRRLYATKKIGDITERLYDERILDLAIRWARDEGLLALDLGAGADPHPGLITVDVSPHGRPHILADLRERWPLGDNTVGVVRASHVFEHLPDKVHTLNELHRVLAPGGWAFIEVPSALGAGAFQDPSHVSYWVKESFAYVTDRHFQGFVPGLNARFQARRLEHASLSLGGTLVGTVVPTIRADLVALKEGYRPPGHIHI